MIRSPLPRSLRIVPPYLAATAVLLACGASGCSADDGGADGTDTLAGETGADASGESGSSGSGSEGSTSAGTSSGGSSSGTSEGSGSSSTGSSSDSGTASSTGEETSGGEESGSSTGDGSGETSGESGGHDPGAPQLVVYWGQNGYGGANPGDPSKYEKSLGDTCRDNPHYDVIVLAFMTSFVSQQNADHYPALNFSLHCETPWDDGNPFLLRCPEIGADVQDCQDMGIRVLISMGGASGAYGFASDDEARDFAQTTWDMFLGGSSEVRPFGDAVLDGIDLDIEGGSTVGYAAFVTRLRELVDQGSREYLIAAAPQCPFPDAYVGPAPGKALGDAADAFDFLFVQFYNNYCSYGSPMAFAETWSAWAGLHEGDRPRIAVGLPAAPGAAPAGGYVDPGTLPALVDSVKDDPAFGGVMLWDASFDQNSDAGGRRYGEVVAELIGP